MRDTIWLRVEHTAKARKLIEKGIDLYPTQAHKHDAGIDIRACIDRPRIIRAGSFELIGTGLLMELSSEKWEIQVRSRSGLAAKNGVFVLNSPGTIDYSYREEVKVILCNLGKEGFPINPGDRIAQICVRQVPEVIIQFGAVNKTDRGGFGSTGIE